MSKWTHAICDKCWSDKNTTKPLRVNEGPRELCCFCGKSTDSGIYIKRNPDKLRCKGVH